MSVKTKKKIFLGKNIDYLLKQSKMDIKNLSAATGIPAATISRMKKDGSNPTISSLEPLLDFFRLDIDSLLYEDISDPRYKAKKQLGDLVHIPIIELSDIVDQKKKYKEKKFIGSSGITNPNVFGIEISSDSLAPVFQKNTTVILDPDLQVKEADYVLCQLNTDKEPIFRQVFIDGSKYFFRPINPIFGEMKAYKKFNILGIVIKTVGLYRG